MGRNLWVNQSDFSRDFTVLVWDDLLGVLPPRPEPSERVRLQTWVSEILTLEQLPTVYKIWRQRPDGWSESDVAHAWQDGIAVQIEGCYDELKITPLAEMPELDYTPPEWHGAERFAELFALTPLTLEAAPLGELFRDELERLCLALDSDETEWGLL